METWEGPMQHQGHVCSQTLVGGFHHAIPPFSLPFRRAVPEHGVCILPGRAEQTGAGWCPVQWIEAPTSMEHQGRVGCGTLLGIRPLTRIF